MLFRSIVNTQPTIAGNPALGVTRLTPNGDLDKSFGNNGSNFAGGVMASAWASGALLDPTGKVIITGERDQKFTVSRFTGQKSCICTCH